MRQRTVWCLGLLLFLPPAWAFDEPATPKEKFQAIQKELTQAMQELNTKFREAKTDEEKAKVREEAAALHTKFAEQLADFAAKNLRDEAAFDALKFAVSSQLSLSKSEKPFEVLAQEFVQHEKIDQIVAGLARAKSGAAVKFLRAVVAKNTDNATKGKGTYFLAIVLKNMAESSGASADELKKMVDETKKLLQNVIDNFADITIGMPPRETKIADAAKKELELLNKIAVGAVHPEIDGEDTDGKKFKLSDYRGKVILLDFWGHW